MAAPIVDITATTADAAPGDPPYRVSHDPAKDDFAYDWTIEFDNALGYWQERFEGTTRINGAVRNRRGVVCGMGVRCGHPHSILLQATDSPQERSDTWDDIDSSMSAEGPYRFGVDALNDDGWSA